MFFKSFSLMIVLLLTACTHTCAQYFQFSQYEFTTQRVNPATTGITPYALLDLDSRTQKTGGGFNINSNFVAASLPLLHPSTGTPWSGVGISLMNDQSSGIFKKQEAALSYALHVQLSREQKLSFGVKALYQTSRVSLDGLNTGAQYVRDRGFDSGVASGEPFMEGRNHYTTFSTGVAWQQTDRQGNLVGQWGVSLFDINKPSYSYLGNPTPVPTTMVANVSFRLAHDHINGLFPEVLFTRSASTSVLNAGFRLRHELKSLPNQTADKIDLITRYVPGRSGIVGLQLHRENLSLGISYDFPAGTRNTSNLGALEIGLTLRKLVETKRKKIARQRQIERDRLAAKRKAVLGKPQAKEPLQPAMPVEVVTVDTIKQSPSVITKDANAGQIKSDPIMLEKITLHFHFEYNRVDLDDESESFLQQLATSMKKDPTLTLKISGHTDNIGPEKFNLKLSQKRADAVRDFLIGEGIESIRIEAVGKGMSVPLNANDTEENQAKNRRVEILVEKRR